MTDIYDIKDIVFPLPISVFNTILVIVVFLLVYFLLFRKRKDFVEIVEEIKEEKIDFREVILDFEKKYLLLESKDFLREISFIFRNFLEQDL
jgi:short subunit fatty acids transporter